MKKIIIILGIILTSGIAALALTTKSDNKIAQVKTNEVSQDKGHEFGAFKSDMATAD